MAYYRAWKDFNFKNPNFIGVSLALIIVYLIYLYEFIVRQGAQLSIAWLIITTFFYVMSLWAYVVVVITDPGRVPLFWGLYNVNPHERKFCLICHNFKPQRCHHCSKCHQCVLNMDHHCPWINNCVGFYNRKYFLLFLFYQLLTLSTALIQMFIIEISQISAIAESTRSTDIHTALRLIEIIFCLLLFAALCMFFHMHIGMVLDNTTTLEAMVRERKRRSIENNEMYFDQKLEENVYDIDSWYNFTQVFGESIFFWFIPIEESLLRSKGVFWQKKKLNRDDSRGSNQQTLHLNPSLPKYHS